MKPRISVIIPHWPAVLDADYHLTFCLESMRGQAEKFIVVVNDGTGYAKAVNQGMRVALGDDLIVANNDTQLLQGRLEDLWRLDRVTVPQIIPPAKDNNPRCFFFIPAFIASVVGPFDERFEGGYWEDDDYIRRLNDAGVLIEYVPKVVVSHYLGGGASMKVLGEQKFWDENKARFEEKWKIEKAP